MDSKPSATAPRPRRLRRRQTIGLVLNMAYGHASAPNRPPSLPRSTMAGLATRMALNPSLGNHHQVVPRSADDERHPMKGAIMTSNTIVSRKEWLAQRLELLRAEKEHTRRSDELTQRRQELPWVRVDKTYWFETEKGKASLAELFQ